MVNSAVVYMGQSTVRNRKIDQPTQTWNMYAVVNFVIVFNLS
jgi:hypothetical protein